MENQFEFTEQNLMYFYEKSVFNNKNKDLLLEYFSIYSKYIACEIDEKRNVLILKIENYYNFCKENLKKTFFRKQIKKELEIHLDNVFEYSLVTYLLLKYKGESDYFFKNFLTIAKQEYRSFIKFLVQKNKEYGNASISDGLHFISNSVRLNDKRSRIISLQKITDIKFESELDTVKDCLGYSILGKIIHENFYNTPKV